MTDVNNTNSSDSNRRDFIKYTTGGATTFALAGCLGEDDSGNGGGEDGGDGNGGGNGDGNGGDSGQAFSDGDTVDLIVAFGPGGGFDTYSRMIAPYLENHLPADVSVRVENVEGGDNLIGWNQAYNADSDGLTHMITHSTSMTQSQFIEDQAEFDVADMTWFGQVAVSYHAWGTRPGLVDDFDEFIEGVNNGDFLFGGTTGTPLFATTFFGAVTGLYDPTQVADNYVSYDGTAQAMEGLISGDIDAVGTVAPNWAPFVESGDAEALALMITEETMDTYDPPQILLDQGVPTMTDLEIPNAAQFEATYPTIRGFAGPPDIPEDTAETIRTAYHDAIHDEEFQADAAEAERPIVYTDAQTLREKTVGLMDTWEEHEDLLQEMLG